MSRLTECLEREVEELRAAVAARNEVILDLADVAMCAVEVSRSSVMLGRYGRNWTGVDDAILADLEHLADRGRKVVTS